MRSTSTIEVSSTMRRSQSSGLSSLRENLPVAVVLHGLGPVVHQVLVNVISINQQLVLVVRQQPFGQLHNHLQGMAARPERLERGCALVPPDREMCVHAGDENGELRMLIDGGLNRRFLDRQIDIARSVGLEEHEPELWAHLPIRLQRIHIGNGNAALEVAFNVLQVLRRLAVDVTWQVQVVVVLLDLCKAHHTGVARHFKLAREDVDDLVNVLGGQPVLGAVLHESLAGVDHEDALAGVGVLLVNNDDAGRDAGAVEEVCGQADDAFDVAFADEGASDVGLGVAPEQYPVGQNSGTLACAVQRPDDVQRVPTSSLVRFSLRRAILAS